MEDPNSWGTLEKAIAAAEEEFWSGSALCDGPEPIDLVAVGIANGLVDRGIVSPRDNEDAEKAILEAMIEHKKELEQHLCGRSRTSAIARKLEAAGLANVD